MTGAQTVEGGPALTREGLTPAAAALLEEATTAAMLVGHLVADAEEGGDEAVIPEALQASVVAPPLIHA
jgi:hypothetical protein